MFLVTQTISDDTVTGPYGELSGNNSYVYFAKDHPEENVPGGGGSFRIIDTTTFPISKTIAAAVVTLKPKAIRELHWHPNVRRNF